MTDKEFPYNGEAEKTVLGALLQGGDINAIIAEIELTADDFYITQNREVFAAMMRLYEQNKAIDFVTVDNELSSNPAYSGVTFLRDAALSTPTTRHMEYYAKIVKDMSQRRKFIQIGADIQNIAADREKSIDEITDTIEAAMIANSGKSNLTFFNELAISAYQDIIDAYKRKGEIPGQKTGWKTLDIAIGGLEGLIVVGARPSMGKSMFGTNIAEEV